MLFVLAAGGDPRRGLGPGSPAAVSLAADLDDAAARNELASALDWLAQQAYGLDAVTAALDRLREEPDLAWRWLACALLVDELDDEGP